MWMRLARLLGLPTSEEIAGARLEDRSPWVVPATRDGAAFLRALPSLVPESGFVYFEGTTQKEFASWADEHAVPSPLKIARGTIWPRPDWFHVPAQPALLDQAASLVEQHGIALPSVHVHAHDGTRVILQWHDAFVDDPMAISTTLPREQVETFARRLNVGPVSRADSDVRD